MNLRGRFRRCGWRGGRAGCEAPPLLSQQVWTLSYRRRAIFSSVITAWQVGDRSQQTSAHEFLHLH